MIAADRPSPAPAKLLAIDAEGQIRHKRRSDLAMLFDAGDLIVANDAATLPASLSGTHQASGKPVEVRLAAWRSSPATRGRGTAEGGGGGGPLHHAAHGPPPPSQAMWEEPAVALPWLADPTRFVALVFGAGDYRTPTEHRPPPPLIEPGDRLALGPLVATIANVLGHPRLVELCFAGGGDAVLAAIARHGRPVQYAHVHAPLALWDVWTRIAARPIAFEPPSAGLALDWRTLAAWRRRGVGFATLTHAAGLSSTGDPALDRRLPFDEPYRIPASTAVAIARTRSRGGRIVAIGTTVVRALESAAGADGGIEAGDGVATGRITRATRLRVVDAVLTGVHQPGEGHYELLGAFAGDATLDRMAAEAEARFYRAHEFGDSVLIERQPRAPRRYSTAPMIGPYPPCPGGSLRPSAGA